MQKPTTRTTNAILLDNDDQTLIFAIREKRFAGWAIADIARYYNIFYNQTDDDLGRVPPKLYKV